MHNDELTTEQQIEMASLENAIERGFKAFLEVGQALATIREKKLYRERYDTFEDYCQERWKFSRQRAYQLLSAAAMLAIATAPEGKITASWVESTIDVLQDAENTGGFVNIGKRYAAFDAAITHQEHQSMIHKKEQLAAPKQKPLALFEGVLDSYYEDDDPDLGFTFIGHMVNEIEALQEGESYRFVVYRAKEHADGD